MRKIETQNQLKPGQLYIFWERLPSGKFGRRIVAEFLGAADKEKCKLTRFYPTKIGPAVVRFANWEVYQISESQKEEFRREG